MSDPSDMQQSVVSSVDSASAGYKGEVFSTPDEYVNELKASDLHYGVSSGMEVVEGRNGKFARQGGPSWGSYFGYLGDELEAQFAGALHENPSAEIYRAARRGAAEGFAPHDWDELPGGAGMRLQAVAEQARAAIPEVSIDDARSRVKQEGLDGTLKLPDQPTIKTPVLEMMINDANERRDREVAIAQGPQGFLPGALGLVTSLGAGMIDPVNAAAFSIPVCGPAVVLSTGCRR